MTEITRRTACQQKRHVRIIFWYAVWETW